MNLYELTNTYKQVQDLIEEGGEGLQDTLDSLTDSIEIKADGYAKVIKNLEALIPALKEEEERIAERRKSLENNVGKLKKSLETAMIETDMKKFKTTLFSFNIQKNVPSLPKNLNNANIPLRCYIQQEPKLDRKQLLADIKNGLQIDGIELTQTESLRIR